MNVLPTTPIHELVAFQPSAQLPAVVPNGDVLRIAADRWLIVGSLPAEISASSTVAITDVTGKWREIRLTGHCAHRLLANCVDVEQLFAERDCARTTLFDCPAVLRRLDDGYSIWIEGSYSHAFITAAEQAGAL